MAKGKWQQAKMKNRAGKKVNGVGGISRWKLREFDYTRSALPDSWRASG